MKITITLTAPSEWYSHLLVNTVQSCVTVPVTINRRLCRWSGEGNMPEFVFDVESEHHGAFFQVGMIMAQVLALVERKVAGGGEAVRSTEQSEARRTSTADR